MHGVCQDCGYFLEKCRCERMPAKRITLARLDSKTMQMYCVKCSAPLTPGKSCGCLRSRPGWEETGGVKFDQDKPRMDLIDACAAEELAKVLTFGAQKYAAHNWRKGIKLSRLIAASFRHLVAIMRGENVDPETGLAHAAHLMCCAMFMVWTMKHLPAMDDRWKENAEDEFKGGHNHD